MDHMEYGLEFCEKTLMPIIKNVVDKYIGTSYSIEKKGQGNFVTTVDKKIEQELIDRFQQLVPGSGVIAEETEAQLEQKFNWIIDPIDGTTNFIHGLPQYAVSVALTYCGEPIAAVVYDVAKNELFTAAKGQGAKLDSRRIRVSENDEMRRSLIGTGFPFRPGADIDGYLKGFKNVAERSAGIRRPGSAALDLCWVACGRYDGFWEFSLKPWDVAAGGLIVLEAGGLITDLTGGEEWLETGNVCAGNPKIFAQLLPLVGKLSVNTQSEAPQSEKAQTKNDKARRTLSTKKA